MIFWQKVRVQYMSMGLTPFTGIGIVLRGRLIEIQPPSNLNAMHLEAIRSLAKD